MSRSIFQETSRRLREYADRLPTVLVAYSGGKDSLVVLGLCVRAFAKAICCHLHFVPGMRWTENQVALARSRWGVEVIECPEPAFMQSLRKGLYCNSHYSLDAIPDIKSNHIFQVVAREQGISLIASGIKKADGLNKAGTMKSEERKESEGIVLFNPIFDWRHADVLAYLSANHIPIPASDGRKSSSFDMTIPNLLWLHDEWPDDFARIARWFPYIWAVVKRRELYGIPKTKRPSRP